MSFFFFFNWYFLLLYSASVVLGKYLLLHRPAINFFPLSSSFFSLHSAIQSFSHSTH